MNRAHTLLVVEDNPDHVTLVRRALTRRRSPWLVVADCDEVDQALHLANQHRPDATAVDLTLGSQSGRDLISELIVQHPAMMVVALSAEPADRARAEVLALGAFGYIEKTPQLFVDGALADRLSRLHVTFRHAIDEDADTVIPVSAG